ncbi:MAG: Rrf2 family transcriptional regulator [Saprospiraceae bacterium]|nr:Rrf2 family transcriptional regulator [Saprospiraceae bacterium]MBK9630866.1 Rrf2 family transcriptional regulator [Saprospiraceae bacterium]
MFSKTTEYALRAIIYLAKHSDINYKIGIATVASAIDAPKSFTAKILQKLTKDNFPISSIPGPNGGLYMTMEGKNTTVLQVLELLNEDHVINKCVLGLQECNEETPCPMHARYKLIKPLLQDMFITKTLNDLALELDHRIRLNNSILPLKTEKKRNKTPTKPEK